MRMGSVRRRRRRNSEGPESTLIPFSLAQFAITVYEKFCVHMDCRFLVLAMFSGERMGDHY